MSTFACGGGSTMGYKRAGCTIVAANDIDPEMAWHYKKNLNPTNYFLCPIGVLITSDLPPDLYELDILDGSPPCSTFSMAGSREKAWGKNKHFREGQAKQVLSDLFFDYIDLVARLRPKVAIAENVKGMLLGNAKGYVKMIMTRFREIGYRPQLFLVNAADCGVPQRRERVFFVAIRDDIKTMPLRLVIQHRWVSAGEAIKDLANLTVEEINDSRGTITDSRFWADTKPGQSYSEACMKLRGKASFFNHVKTDPAKPSFTVTSNPYSLMHWETPRRFTFRELKRFGSFPDDYYAKTENIGKYIIGMSVPPKMTEAVARAVIDQWLQPKAAA